MPALFSRATDSETVPGRIIALAALPRAVADSERMTTANDPGPAPSAARDIRWLLLGFGLLYLFLLGRLPLANPDESRYAEIPREMLARGDWVRPYLNDVPYFEKPPLVYWTVGLARTLFGPGEFAARLTPALFGLGGVLLLYAAGRSFAGRRAGLLAAAVLGTSLLYFGLARILLLDMAVSVLMSATLVCFWLGVREPAGRKRQLLFLGLYASAALATLAKGLIGFLIPGAVMFLWLLIFNQWARLRPLHLPTGIALFLALAAPWHVLAALRHPEWAQFYFVQEHWERFTSTGHLREEPVWFFGPVLLLGLMPWTGFLPAALRESLAGGWARRKENADAWFFVTWAAFIVLFFTKSQSKLIPYILPALPPLALLVGAWLARRWDEGAAARPRLRFGFGAWAFFAGLLAVALIFAVLKPGLIRDPAQVAALRPYAFGLAAVLAAGGVFAPWAAKLRGAAAGVGALLFTMAIFYGGLVLASPHFARAGAKELGLVARERIPAGEPVFHYWMFLHDFVYYSERPVGLVGYKDELQIQFLDAEERARRFVTDAELRRRWAGPERLWLVVRKRDQRHAESVFADAAFRYHLIADTPVYSLLSNRP
ncbi:MAG: hypothetical protein B9S34_04755 [Opitutia bacterium Tous-C1TDCM]|nr:MAG: hypothetical protein B9S34_04755 [Opitutae bacterium Tous-C1TDCM]